MIYFLTYEHSGSKHEKMPKDYPWAIVDETCTSPLVVQMSEEYFEAYKNSFDLTEYHLAVRLEKDKERYDSRARVRDDIIAWMAATNMERVKNGIWTVAQLTSLTQDPELKLVLDDVNTLSYELAVSKIQNLSNPIITMQIKQLWITKLIENLF